MRGDAVRAGGFADQRRFDRIRFTAVAPSVTRLPQRRDVIDIHPQLEHGTRLWLGRLRFGGLV